MGQAARKQQAAQVQTKEAQVQPKKEGAIQDIPQRVKAFRAKEKDKFIKRLNAKSARFEQQLQDTASTEHAILVKKEKLETILARMAELRATAKTLRGEIKELRQEARKKKQEARKARNVDVEEVEVEEAEEQVDEIDEEEETEEE